MYACYVWYVCIVATYLYTHYFITILWQCWPVISYLCLGDPKSEGPREHLALGPRFKGLPPDSRLVVTFHSTYIANVWLLRSHTCVVLPHYFTAQDVACWGLLIMLPDFSLKFAICSIILHSFWEESCIDLIKIVGLSMRQ